MPNAPNRPSSLCGAYKRELRRDRETISVSPRNLGFQEPQASLILARWKQVKGRQIPVSNPLKLLLRREPPNVRPLFDHGVPEARCLERIDDLWNRREPIPIDGQHTREGLLQNAETAGGHIRRRHDDPMRHPRDLAEGRGIVTEMVEHHDDQREIKRVCPKWKAVSIAPHALERSFRTGDPEHGHLRVKGHHGMCLREERRKPAGTRPDVEDTFAIPQSTHLDEPAKPEFAVRSVVGPNAIVVRGTSRIVDLHASCKREAANEDNEVQR